MAICGKDESASPDATVILLEQMGLDYHSDLADFAGNLESMTSYNLTSYGYKSDKIGFYSTWGSRNQFTNIDFDNPPGESHNISRRGSATGTRLMV
jgi:hypothetical protein